MTTHRYKGFLIFPRLVLIATFLSACALPIPTSSLPLSITPTVTSTDLIASPSPSSTSYLAPSPSLPTDSLTASSALPTSTTTPTVSFTPTSTRSVSPASLSSSTHYTLTLQLDYAAHFLSVNEQIVYTNPTTYTLTDLVFVVEPNRQKGNFQLIQLAWEDGSEIKDYVLENNLLRISLPNPLIPSTKIAMTISYELTLPAIPGPSETDRPIPYGYTAHQANLVDWYPFLPPYRPSQGWLVHDPGYFGEHLVYDVADYDVDISLVKTDPTLVIAASSLPQKKEGGYHYQLELARSFAFSISPDYHVFSDTVGTVTVLSYAFPFTLEAGKAALENTVDALTLYSRLFGPYPHNSLSVVEADFLDGMEYDGLYFLSRGFYNLYDGSPQGYLTIIAVHETAHQWWYGLVGNDQAREPWLDEALCTYSEKLFYENTYPRLVDWWWYFRVNYYRPTGWVNSPIYTYNGFRPYVNAVYLRGALFLEDLRKELGDQVFFTFLRDYITQKSHQLATTQDFFAILKEHTSKDIEGLLKEYFQP